ncbi:MAG: hypothetical protein V1755_14010 [Chloroflexota bacterium]
MDNPFSQAGPGSSAPRREGWLSSLQVLGRILDWLAALVQLTDEQQEQAGVYLGDRRRRQYPGR